ncbi:MAG: hypothetical protein IJQ66_02820 [Clostridia bacterium]|nr:hypothetical protein [Clostridia bacterium]
MTFETPATENQMYSILQDIFFYYRIRREADSEVELEELSLSRAAFTPSTASQLRTKAEKAVAPAQQLRLLNYKAELEKEIAELTEKIALYGAQQTAMENKARADYAAAVEKAEHEAMKKGIADSSIVVNRIAELSTALSAEITAIDTEMGEKIATATARRTALNSKLSAANTYFADVNESEIVAKVEEIKEGEAKITREIFRYNNGLSEKEQRYANTVLTTMRELELKYMNITQTTFSKDELVEMGYYEDAIRCVCAYYDTLTDLAAYQNIVHNRKVAIYLDDYYSNVVYMYKTRAGV